MVGGQSLVLELGHEAVSTEERLGDHLLVLAARNLPEETIEAEFALQHLIQRALKHDRTRVLRVIEHGLVRASEGDAPGGGEIIESGAVVSPSAGLKEIVEILVPLRMTVLRGGGQLGGIDVKEP